MSWPGLPRPDLEKVVFVQNGQTLTYGALETQAHALATEISLKLNGNTRDCPVGLLARAGFQYFVGLLAIFKCGALAVPMQPNHPKDELRHVINDSGLALLLLEPGLEGIVNDFTNLTVIPLIQTLSVGCQPVTSAWPTPEPSAGALMIYTSGTTGRSKGVVSTYLNVESQVRTLHSAWEWSSEDRTINVLPLHHIHGVVVLGLCALFIGARQELVDRFSPELVWKRIGDEDLTVFMAVPTIFARLIEYWRACSPHEQRRLSEAACRLRLVVSGSAALPLSVFEAWREIAKNPLLERYGMSEIGMALTNPYRGERRPGEVGMPFKGMQVRLCDEQGQIVEGSGQPGEIQVRGPSVFREYWRNPSATQSSFTSDGWFKTGDMAERTELGNYRILGRLSQDILKTGGYKVSALEIENVLLEHPAIAEVAVIGMPDEVWGERVAAFMVLRSGHGVDVLTLTQFCQSRLARYKIPTLWHFRNDLPRNAMGKLVKSQLRASVS